MLLPFDGILSIVYLHMVLGVRELILFAEQVLAILAATYEEHKTHHSRLFKEFRLSAGLSSFDYSAC